MVQGSNHLITSFCSFCTDVLLSAPLNCSSRRLQREQQNRFCNCAATRENAIRCKYHLSLSLGETGFPELLKPFSRHNNGTLNLLDLFIRRRGCHLHLVSVSDVFSVILCRARAAAGAATVSKSTTRCNDSSGQPAVVSSPFLEPTKPTDGLWSSIRMVVPLHCNKFFNLNQWFRIVSLAHGEVSTPENTRSQRHG